MWKIKATWKQVNNGNAEVSWNPLAWPDFGSFLIAISPNTQDTVADLTFVTERLFTANNYRPSGDNSIGWVTELEFNDENKKNEVLNYYNNTIVPRYSHMANIIVEEI